MIQYLLSRLTGSFTLQFEETESTPPLGATLPKVHSSKSALYSHDDAVHHPLGAGSYYFRDSLIQHLSSMCPRDITISIGAQPNSSPHMGTIISFATAFCIASRLARDCGRSVMVSLDIVDTAPSQQVVVDGVTYQRSQRFTGEMEKYMADFLAVLESLRIYTGIAYQLRTQAEFLGSPLIPKILREILDDQEMLGASFSPKTGRLAIRAACPATDCGWADKHGIRNVYKGGTITFTCPYHGTHIIDTADLQGIQKLEFNTPLRNMIRARAFSQDPVSSWIRVTGADYAGYYQEQLLWRYLREPFVTFYSPLILDWSGAKLSKSLYVKSGAYQYLEASGLDYLVSYTKFVEQGRDLRVIFDEVTDWVEHPYKLFRAYSIEYINSVFSRHL